MQFDLPYTHALRLRNVLDITGNLPKLDDYPTETAVFDVDSIGLLRIANNSNRGIDMTGNTFEKNDELLS